MACQTLASPPTPHQEMLLNTWQEALRYLSFLIMMASHADLDCHRWLFYMSDMDSVVYIEEQDNELNHTAGCLLLEQCTFEVQK